MVTRTSSKNNVQEAVEIEMVQINLPDRDVIKENVTENILNEKTPLKSPWNTPKKFGQWILCEFDVLNVDNQCSTPEKHSTFKS